MATTIKLKNGSGAPSASDLVQGEPALDLTNKRLYTEDSGGSVIEIGSNPSSLSIDGTAITATAAEINTLDGITSSTAELNILDGVTSTAAELNILDGVTATAAELNVLDGVTAFVDEDNMSSNSATSIPSQQSVKAYVDAQTGGGGATLSGLSDTNVTSPADAALLFYDTGTSKWIDNVVSGDITIADTGVAAIGAGVIVNADINASAAIDVSKTALAAGTGLTLTTNTLSVDAAQTQITSVGTLSSLSVSGTLTLGGTAITSTAAELNILDGVTSTAAELNILDGVTATTAELNILDGVTATAVELNILDGVTATTAELNHVDGVTSNIQTQLDAKGTGSVSSLSDLGVTATAAELNLVDGSSAGTIVNSKAVVYGSSGEVNATTLQIAGTSITSTAAELNILDGVTSTTAELNILDGVTATTAELNFVDGVTSNIQTQLDAKGTASSLSDLSVTASASELNILDGVTSTTAELNILDGVTSTAAELNILDGVTSTASELNLVDGSSANTVVNSKAVIYGSAGEVTASQVDITGQGDLRLQDSTGGEYVGLQAPATVGSSFTLTLPTADGTADQMLKTDGSGNLGFTTVASGGLAHLSTITASGAATVDVETTFDATYDAYKLIVTDYTPASDGQQVQILMKIGGSYLTSGYHWASITHDSNQGGRTDRSGSKYNEPGSSYIMMGLSYASDTQASANFVIDIYNPADTAIVHMIRYEGTYFEDDNDLHVLQGFGANNTTGALTGIRIKAGSGNISGRFRLYGITNG